MALLKAPRAMVVYNFVLLLLCVANLLNLFVPRYVSEEDSALRLPIQVTYGLVCAVILPSIYLYTNDLITHYSVMVRVFITFILLYFVLGMLLLNVPLSTLSPYLRLITWTSATLFFIKYTQGTGGNNKFLAAFVLLFILVSIKKLFEIIGVQEDRLGAGDTAGLTFALLIPSILLLFKGNFKIILTALAIFLVFASVRRTAIICVVLSMPFIYWELKSQLKTIHIVIFTVLFLGVCIYAWQFYGDILYDRFDSLLVGDRGGKKDSFGSGRSVFWALVFNTWADSPPLHFAFGWGIGSVRYLLATRYADIGHTHDDYLEIVYTFGLVGLLIWLGTLVKLFSIIKHIRKYAPDRVRILIILFITFGIISVFSGTLFKADMIIFAIPIGLIISETMRNRELVAIVKQVTENAQPIPNSN